jgi:hypothetical protein
MAVTFYVLQLMCNRITLGNFRKRLWAWPSILFTIDSDGYNASDVLRTSTATQMVKF